MTYESTTARAELLQRPDPARISRFLVDGEHVDFPVSESDTLRDTAWSADMLGRWGIESDGRILVSALSWHGAWFDPVRYAAIKIGACYSNIEAWGWDVTRFSSFLSRFDFDMLIGVGSESLAALAQTGRAAELLGRVGHILAQPDAVAPLAELGIDASVIAMAGPALLAGDPSSEGLLYNQEEWLIESDGGELLVTTCGPRAERFENQRTGVRGSVSQIVERSVVSMDGLR
ncbi:MAG: hypothetical protein ACR2JI_17135 [Mycobacterium sp.]